MIDIKLQHEPKLNISIRKEDEYMAYEMVTNGLSMNVLLKHFVADAKEDLDTIDVSGVSMGSTCYVINEQATYILNGNKSWMVKPSGGGGGGIIPDPSTTYIYDGGSVSGV